MQYFNIWQQAKQFLILRNKINNMKTNNLRTLRKKRKLSQKQLSELINISQSMISNIESGRSRLDVETASMFARFYDVSINQITGDKEINLFELNDVEIKNLPEVIKDRLISELLAYIRQNK